jgi:hypothetical protein
MLLDEMKVPHLFVILIQEKFASTSTAAWCACAVS